MFDAATRRELAAMVRERAEDELEADEERQFLVLVDDRDEFAANFHAAVRGQHLLAPSP